jgi:CRP/FNR family transcriptional regulator, nitrogen oxide reductase regulator
LKNLKEDNTDLSLNSKVEVFRQSSRFADLGEDELCEIAALTISCHFKKGDFIFHEGDPPNYFYIILDGRAKLSKVSLSGKSFIFHVATRSNSLNSAVLFEGKGHYLSAQAMDDVTVLCVRRKEYLAFVKEHPIIAMKTISMLGDAMNSAYDRIIDLVGERVDQRLCNIIRVLHLKFGNTLHFTCEEIGDLAGTTTETTIRVLSKLKDLGILRPGRGKIIILDEAKLRELTRGQYLI